MRQTTAEALVENYRPLVRRIAQHLKRRVSHRAEMNNLMQAGMEGLIESAPRYKPESGASFDTFAGYRIRGAMYDSLREHNWAPRSVTRNGRAIAEAISAVELREQRPARESEIAAHMGLTLNEYRERLLESSTQHVFSLDEAPAVNNAACQRPTLEEEVAAEQFDTRLRAAIAALPERERRVIEWTHEGMTLSEAGRILGVKESRACQLRTQGVARLRAQLTPFQ